MIISKKEISTHIEKLKAIINPKTTVEAMKGILFEEGNLIASNARMTVKTKLEGIEQAEKPFIIPPKAFELIKNIPDENINITVTDNGIIIQSDSIKTTYQTIDAKCYSYPNFNVPDGVEIDFEILKKLLKSILYAVSIDEKKAIMNSVCIESDGDYLNVVGLDGYRIAWNRVKFIGDTFCLMLPRTTIERMLKLDITGKVNISYNDVSALIKSDKHQVYMQTIVGEFYKYKQMFSEMKLHAKFDRLKLNAALFRASLLYEEKDKLPISIEMKKDSKVNIEFVTAITKYTETLMSNSAIEDDIKIYFNPKYILEALKEFDAEEIEITLESNKNPVMIYSSNTLMRAIVLPVNKPIKNKQSTK